jgi:hypothetical protein
MTRHSTIYTNGLESSYDGKLQLKTIREEYDSKLQPIDGSLDALDEEIQQCARQGTRLLTVLLEDNSKYDSLEAAIHNEYDHLFESIEVLPELIYRGTLREADAVGGQPTTQGSGQQVQMQPIKAYRFPFNAPIIAGTLKGISPQIQQEIKNKQAVFVNYQPNNEKYSSFCKNATWICSQFYDHNMKFIDESAYFAASPEALSQFLAKKNIATLSPVEISGNLSVDPNACVSVYKLLIEISDDLKSKKIKENAKATETYLSSPEGVSKTQLIVELMAQAQDTQLNSGVAVMDASQRAQALKEWRVQALGKLGVTADLSQMFNSLNSHGLGLVTDAVNLIATRIKMEKDAAAKNKKVDSRSLIVSHTNFEKLWKLLPDEKSILLQEGAKEAAEVNKNRSKDVSEKKDSNLDDKMTQTSAGSDEGGESNAE